VFGLHARTVNAAVNTGLSSKCARTSPSPSVSLQDTQFGLRGPDERTAEWAIYGTGSNCTTTDPFWCFTNAVRQDMGVNGMRIDGNGIINAMRWGNRLAPLGYANAKEWRQWSPEKMGNFLDINAFDYVASDIPWNGKTNPCEPGNPHYVQGSGFVTESSAECDQYIRDLVKAVKTARPKVKVLVYFHAFLSGESNATEKYPNDRILDDQGDSLCWDSSACKQACDEWVYFFGTSTNKYGRQLDAYIDKVFALGADGICARQRRSSQILLHRAWRDQFYQSLLVSMCLYIYLSIYQSVRRSVRQLVADPAVDDCHACADHDESAYSVTEQHGKAFGQIIYNPSLPWDGVTIATTTIGTGGSAWPKITGLPSMTGLVRLQHKKELYARVFQKGGFIVANDPPVTRTFRTWLVEQARLHAATGGKQGGVAVHFAETGQQVRGRVAHTYTPVMMDRCGTEGQSPDEDPRYNHT
jgi:hypothetical protein